MTLPQLGGLRKVDGRLVCLALRRRPPSSSTTGSQVLTHSVVRRPADREHPAAPAPAGQLIAMTEWTLPRPEPETGGEVPCPRP